MRKIILHLEQVTDEQYAHIANALWALGGVTGCEYSVEADGDLAKLDEIWDSYSNVSWKHGAKRGTRMFETAKQVEP